MKEVRYSTKDECIKAIDTLKALNMDPLPWMTAQLEDFEAAEHAAHESGTPIWDTLKARYPYGTMPEEKIACVESTVDRLLEDGERAEEPGLLLGKIQCGKTDTFEDIIGLAFDRGIDVAIVITKGTKALVNQTIKRMKKDFRFFKATDSLDQRTTVNIHDIMDVWRNLKQARVDGCKTVIVCKKNPVNLDHLTEMFQTRCPFLREKKVLIVDDEADFASRNYRSVTLEAVPDEDGTAVARTRETVMARIAQQIDDFRKIPGYCRYLQVTATPYCLYLQPQGELNLNGNIVKPFKPRFTSLVPVHDRYIGGQQYFVESQDPDSMYSHLFHQVEQKCIDVLGHEDKRYLRASVSSGNIYGLTYALVSYFMATAARRIQVAASEHLDYKTSAIIHVEVDKKNHDWQCRVVNRLIGSIRSAVVDEDQSDQRIWAAIDTIYSDFQESCRKGLDAGLISVALPSKEGIMSEMRNIFNMNNYHVQMVNSDEQMESLLDEETGELILETAATIFIGGNILDRGVTIQNLLCFFYGRNPRHFQQDTVLQHARMYGARPKEDMAVMRLHTTAHIYRTLARMNDLDEQLRQWFIEGRDGGEPNAVFVGYDRDIRPCASQKIKASNAITLTRQQRLLPIGFWTGTRTATGRVMERIDSLITGHPNYGTRDADGFFEMAKDEVAEILRLIESTYVYEDRFLNTDRKNDIKEILCALEYCASRSDGKVYVLHRTDRGMNRIRENGSFTNAPDDGRSDLMPSRLKAQDAPVMMLIRQNGMKCADPVTGENIGWNNAPFYWPVLLTQNGIDPVMYALDQGRKRRAAAVDTSDILDGIDPSEVLSLTLGADLERRFGSEGTEYADGDCPVETRALKDSTAGRYLLRTGSGEWAVNPEAPLDAAHDHGVYSLNGGRFPFVLKPYRYMLLRNGRDADADAMLLELTDSSRWLTIPEGSLNEDGDLIDRDSRDVLIHGSDTILDRTMGEREFRDRTITQWIIAYAVRKVLRFSRSSADLDAVFGGDGSEN